MLPLIELGICTSTLEQLELWTASVSSSTKAKFWLVGESGSGKSATAIIMMPFWALLAAVGLNNAAIIFIREAAFIGG